MKGNTADTKGKIILPENTQREMLKFFLKTSMPRIEAEGKMQQTSPEKTKKVKE